MLDAVIGKYSQLPDSGTVYIHVCNVQEAQSPGVQSTALTPLSASRICLLLQTWCAWQKGLSPQQAVGIIQYTAEVVT